MRASVLSVPSCCSATQTLKAASGPPCHEALDGLVVVSERHPNIINAQVQNWYNIERSHSARDHLPPGWDKPPEPNNTVTPSEIVCTTRLGGLLNSYARRAA